MEPTSFLSRLRYFANSRASSLINVSMVCLFPTLILSTSTIRSKKAFKSSAKLSVSYSFRWIFFPIFKMHHEISNKAQSLSYAVFDTVQSRSRQSNNDTTLESHRPKKASQTVRCEQIPRKAPIPLSKELIRGL